MITVVLLLLLGGLWTPLDDLRSLPTVAAGLRAAPTVVPTPAQDPSSLVKQVEQHYRSVRTLRAEFVERWSDSPASVRIESGIVSLRRPREMRWEYREPEKKLFLSDGRTVYFYVPADHTVRRSLLRNSADWHVPLAWLAGSARLEKIFSKIEWAPTPQAGQGPSPRALRGLPRSPEDGYREAILEFNESFQLTRLLIRDTVGREMEFRFGKWEENVSLAAQDFRFVVPPGVVVVDESDLVGAGQ